MGHNYLFYRIEKDKIIIAEMFDDREDFMYKLFGIYVNGENNNKIEDGPWLRNALLYWDKVSSIVPGFDYDETNSIEIEYLRDAGLYEPTYPIELQNNEELCKEFCCQIKKRINTQRKGLKGQRDSKIYINKMGI